MTLDYLIGFDTETTGISVVDDRIVTASIVCVAPDGSIHDEFEWLINPGIDIPEGASAVHGVTTEKAQADGVEPSGALVEICKVLAGYMAQGIPIVAYNASYDFSILNSEIKRHSLGESFADFFPDRVVPKLIIDPYVIDKRVDKYRKGRRTLTDSAKLYGVDLENAHTSFDDCLAAVGVARALWDKYPVMSEGDLESLYDALVSWYKGQQEGLAAHFKRQGTEADVNTVWPISTL